MKPNLASLITTIALAVCVSHFPAVQGEDGRASGDSYVVGPGDVLSINDGKHVDSTEIPILPDGTAVTSYFGVINAAGLSVRQLSDLVNEQAKKWIVNPQIKVVLLRQRPCQVYILGEVLHPGLYGSEQVSRSETQRGQDASKGTAKSINADEKSKTLRLYTALRMAGGLKESADIRHLRVTRVSSRQIFQIDCWKLMFDGDATEDIPLQSGDVIYVPAHGVDFSPSNFGKPVNDAPQVRVMGGVKAPGLFPLSPNDDLITVVAKAGGCDNIGLTRSVVVSRITPDGTVSSEKFEFSKLLKNSHSELRAKLHPGDLVIVKKSDPSAQKSNSFMRATDGKVLVGDFGPFRSI